MYVDLFSNSSMELYPDNAVSHFKVKLSRPLELEGEYECALAHLICPAVVKSDVGGDLAGDIIITAFPENVEQKTYALPRIKTFPFNTPNVIQSSYIVRAVEPVQQSITYTPKKGNTSNKLYAFKHTIPKGKTFSEGQDIVEYLNSLFQQDVSATEKDVFNQVIQQRVMKEANQVESKYPVIFFADPYKNQLEVIIRDADFSLALSGSIARILGFTVADDQYVLFPAAGKYTCPQHLVNLNAANPSIMSIYSDVILPHRVADTSAPLIRVCIVPTIKEGEIGSGFLSFEFTALHYFPVALKFIQEIHIEVRGSKGDLFPFQTGILYLRLHFRPSRTDA